MLLVTFELVKYFLSLSLSFQILVVAFKIKKEKSLQHFQLIRFWW